MQAKLRSWQSTVPLQRFGTESEVSAAIVFLLSEAAAYITGSCIRVDGGVPNARQTWTLVPHQHSNPFNGFLLAKPPRCLDPEEPAGAPNRE
jgi:citronellol/citronellal dehydrogenase